MERQALDRDKSSRLPFRNERARAGLVCLLVGVAYMRRPSCSLISRRECPPAPKSQKIVNLGLSPAMVLNRERTTQASTQMSQTERSGPWIRWVT
jgi:hypothetical protein